MNSARRRLSGFTLVELMIVIAIIAILAAIAIPQYQDYIIRTQLSEGLEAATGAKAAIWEFKTNTGHLPATNESAGLPSPASISGRYVSSLQLTQGGKVQVAYNKPETNNNLRSQTLNLSPVDTGGSIGWTCSSAMADRYLPSACRRN